MVSSEVRVFLVGDDVVNQVSWYNQAMVFTVAAQWMLSNVSITTLTPHGCAIELVRLRPLSVVVSMPLSFYFLLFSLTLTPMLITAPAFM